jgi:putative peptide zinc metalloprotease protein
MAASVRLVQNWRTELFRFNTLGLCMDVLLFIYAEHQFSVHLDPEQQGVAVCINEIEVSVKPLDVMSIHTFFYPALGLLSVDIAFDFADHKIRYQLIQNSRVALQGATALSELESNRLAESDVFVAALQPAPEVVKQTSQNRSGILFLSIGLKLLKSVKLFKVALAAASVAVYSVMFTFEFALVLVGVLVFHEYGHLRAMKKFGIATKGMYLIPFFGGIALGDKPRTQWEDVYISMMGPVFGLFLTAVFYVAYRITDSHFCGLVASTSALINLFNLFPVYPLDGGRVVKALVFSRRNYFALVILLLISALCLVATWKAGLFFLSFFVVLGVLDLVTSWSIPLAHDITPLKTYGIWFCLAWYLAVALAFIALIFLIAEAAVPGSELAVKLLQS